MPGVDYAKLKALVPMGQVLDLIHWKPVSITGSQERGRCQRLKNQLY
jgi:hypothetical protein